MPASLADYSEATLPGHLRGDDEGAEGYSAGDVLPGDGPIASALAELKQPGAIVAAQAKAKAKAAAKAPVKPAKPGVTPPATAPVKPEVPVKPVDAKPDLPADVPKVPVPPVSEDKPSK